MSGLALHSLEFEYTLWYGASLSATWEPSDAVTRYIRRLEHMTAIVQWIGDNPDTRIKLVFLVEADP